MSSPPPGYPIVAPYLLYEDAAQAVDFLTRAFGFEVRLAQEGAAGRTHYELVIDGVIEPNREAVVAYLKAHAEL